jgi:hypothetical protein
MGGVIREFALVLLFDLDLTNFNRVKSLCMTYNVEVLWMPWECRLLLILCVKI